MESSGLTCTALGYCGDVICAIVGSNMKLSYLQLKSCLAFFCCTVMNSSSIILGVLFVFLFGLDFVFKGKWYIHKAGLADTDTL